MKIAIVGSGNMGGGLGKLWAKAGHEVIFSYSRNLAKLQQLAVVTIGNKERLDEQSYRKQCASRLVEILFDIENYMGVGFGSLATNLLL